MDGGAAGTALTGPGISRRKGWQDADAHGNKLRRPMGIASLGGAVLDN